RAVPIHFSNSPSRSRRVFAPGFAFFASLTPTKGWRSAERRTDACEASVGPALSGQARRLARRLASHTGDARLPALAPWRLWAAGPRCISPAFAPDRSQRPPRIRVVVPGGGAPASRGDGSRAAAAGRHASLRLQDASGRRPFDEQGWRIYTIARELQSI